ncbi:hypothetical protein GQ600_25910 [Phytophthora cactorum]|nr:hypothetical protein GQ600_25910 [Phytophthora cactorum]
MTLGLLTPNTLAFIGPVHATELTDFCYVRLVRWAYGAVVRYEVNSQGASLSVLSGEESVSIQLIKPLQVIKADPITYALQVGGTVSDMILNPKELLHQRTISVQDEIEMVNNIQSGFTVSLLCLYLSGRNIRETHHFSGYHQSARGLWEFVFFARGLTLMHCRPADLWDQVKAQEPNISFSGFSERNPLRSVPAAATRTDVSSALRDLRVFAQEFYIDSITDLVDSTLSFVERYRGIFLTQMQWAEN